MILAKGFLFFLNLSFAISSESFQGFTEFLSNSELSETQYKDDDEEEEMTCPYGDFVFNPERGFGIVYKMQQYHKPAKGKCVVYQLKTSGYELMERSQLQVLAGCLIHSTCEKLNANEGHYVRAMACVPFNFNGQQVVALQDTMDSEQVDILIRTETATAKKRSDIIFKSKYQQQKIDRNYVVNSATKDIKVQDLTGKVQPYSLPSMKTSVSIVAKCDPKTNMPILEGMGMMLPPGSGLGMGGSGHYGVPKDSTTPSLPTGKGSQ